MDADNTLGLLIIVYLNGDTELTLTYFTETSNFVSLVFIWGKCNNDECFSSPEPKAHR